MSDPIVEFQFDGSRFLVSADGYVQRVSDGYEKVVAFFDLTALHKYVDAEVERRKNTNAARINQLYRGMIDSVAESAPFDEDKFEEPVEQCEDDPITFKGHRAWGALKRDYTGSDIRKLVRKEVKRALKKMAAS